MINTSTPIKIDNILDYIPIVSTFSNLVNLIGKIALHTIDVKSMEKPSYLIHLHDKSYMRCIALLVPILGNLAVILSDAMEETTSNKNSNISSNSISRSNGISSVAVMRSQYQSNIPESSTLRFPSNTTKRYSCTPRIII